MVCIFYSLKKNWHLLMQNPFRDGNLDLVVQFICMMICLCLNLFYCNAGFAFIYMEDERDGEDAIRALDRKEFGRKGRRLRVEWTKVIDLNY